MQARLLTYTILFVVAATAHGGLYKWTDRNGKVHFTDNNVLS
jgi:hypothetical protein